ncbi:MAG: glutathione S-transferase family protein [Xanthomonadales bacterium]|jgi:glutathione S-transferase|nr:glutathione S-transferase family protein [Xanthomonadales bacterium]
MSPIRLWQLAPSFNSRKVRYALGVKGVPYECIEVTDANRDALAALSGQPLSPVLQHGGVVMFDSGAIVRYIDANIPGPRLFSTDPDEMRAIEAWESRSRALVLDPYLQIGKQIRAGDNDGPLIQAARERFFEGARQIESAINPAGVLVGNRLSAADIFCGCYLAYGFLTAEEAGSRPPMVWAARHLSLAETLPKLAVWFGQLRALETR